MDHFDALIVGGGHAGAQAAIALRQAKFTGSVAIVGDEPELPYERPPLSKEYLSGEKAFERLLIRPPAFWADRDIQMRLAHRVLSVDAVGRSVTLCDGRQIGFGSLIWAAGGSPRALTCGGRDLGGVHSIRSRRDVDQLIAELPDVDRPVIIGGGYIGLEAAAVLSKLGKQATIVEAVDRVLARVAGEALSRFYETEHTAHGVTLRLSETVECLEGDTRVTGVRLVGGEVIPTDLVIIGIGIVPNVGPLIEAGAEGGNGVVVDAQCRTTLTNVYAVGDCALHANIYGAGSLMRIESVQNANDQASVAARTIAGQEAIYDAIPWFWSNQYDLKLQTVGLATGYDDVIVRGSPATRNWSAIYLRGGTVVALDCVNAVRDYVQGKALIGLKLTEEGRAAVADQGMPLKDIAALAQKLEAYVA